MTRITPSLLVRLLDFAVTLAEVGNKERNLLQGIERYDDFKLGHICCSSSFSFMVT